MTAPSPQLPVQLRMAAAFLQQGQLTQAQRLFESYLKVQPKHLETLNALALLTFQTEQYDKAVEYLSKAVKLSPRVAGLHNNLGNAYQKLGKIQEALDSYQRALEIDPRFAQALYNRGQLFQSLEQLSEAQACFEKAINIEPNYADAHNGKGIILQLLGQTQAALESYQLAITHQPSHAKAHCNLADILSELKRSQEALAHYDQALIYEPDYLKALNNKGVLLQGLNQFDQALACFDKALQMNPRFWDAHSNRGVTLQKMRRLEESAIAFHQALEMDAKQASVYNNLGNVLGELGRFDEALEQFTQAVELAPGVAQPLINKGIVLQEMGDLTQALASLNQALTLEPENPEAHWSKAVALLLSGQFDQGWQEFEWRWQRQNLADQNTRLGKPLWLGNAPLEHKTILLHGEQGLGDTIQFCRYVSLIARQSAKVILEVPPALVELCRSLDGAHQVIEAGTHNMPDFDYHCPLMSLPLVFKTNLNNPPLSSSYLKADSTKVEFWQKQLGKKTKLRIGLVWSGGFRADMPELWGVNERRNIALEKLAPLSTVNAQFFSLQKGMPAQAELKTLQDLSRDGLPIIDLTNQLHDFSDTAAVIENLDLIISVDTSTAHLAAALGKPTWILNRFDSCWRWLQHGKETMWYPTVKIYRQHAWQDWSLAIEELEADLMNLINK